MDGNSNSFYFLFPKLALLAPDFLVKTVDGEMITKSDLNDKPLVIVNLTGCSSYDVFQIGLDDRIQDVFDIQDWVESKIR